MVVGAQRPLVLVVDDDADHGFMLEALLESDGFDVVTATSREQAQTILGGGRFVDVLVADLALGDGTALDLMKGLPAARRPRVAIVLSGFDSVDDVERTLRAGYDAHLAKPTPLDVLREVIAVGLRKRPSGVRLAHVADARVQAPRPRRAKQRPGG